MNNGINTFYRYVIFFNLAYLAVLTMQTSMIDMVYI